MAWGTPVLGPRATSSDARSGLTVTLPAGATGDLILLCCSSRPGNSFAMTASAGYSLLHAVSTNDTKVFAKLAGASESNPAVTCDTAGAVVGVAIRVGGAPASLTSIIAAANDDENAGTLHQDLSTPGLAVPEDNSLIVLFGAASAAEWVAGTTPAGLTPLYAENFTGDFNSLWSAAAYAIQTAKANIGTSAWDTTSANTVRSNAIILSLRPGASASPSVTDVDTDETVTLEQTGVPIAGSGFGASKGSGSVKIIQGDLEVIQTTTAWGNTAITMTVVDHVGVAYLVPGSATLRVTNDDADFGEIAITINPPSGTVYVNLSTPNTTSAYRISASGDLVAGDQLRARGVGATAFPAGHTLNADATVTVAPATAAVDIEVSAWDASDRTWGAYATQSLATYPVGVTDAASVSVSDSGGVEIAGITEKAGTETASISLTESAAVLVAVGVTDTVALAVTDVSDVDAVLVDKAVTDTASISIADFASVNIVGTVSKTGADAASITVTDTATVQQAPRILSVDISLSEARTDITLS